MSKYKNTSGFKKATSAPKAGPVHKIYVRGVTAAIWANEAEDGRVRFNTTFARAYRDDQGNWKDTDSFGSGDLQNLRKAADEADIRGFWPRSAKRARTTNARGAAGLRVRRLFFQNRPLRRGLRAGESRSGTLQVQPTPETARRPGLENLECTAPGLLPHSKPF